MKKTPMKKSPTKKPAAPKKGGKPVKGGKGAPMSGPMKGGFGKMMKSTGLDKGNL